jgi:hypothetical protein
MPNARRVLALSFLLLFVGLAGCAPPTEKPVCYACEYGVEDAEAANVTVESSSLRVEVRQDGSGRLRVTSNTVGPDVERLRTNETLVITVAEQAVTGTAGDRKLSSIEPIHEGQVTNVTATFDDGVLLINFSVPEIGRTAIGNTLLVDYLHTKGEGVETRELGTDEARFRGPPGTMVTNDPPGAATADAGRTAVWTGSDTHLDSQTYITYGRDDGVGGWTAGQASIAMDVAGWTLPTIIGGGYIVTSVLLGWMMLLWLIVYGRDDNAVRPWQRARGGDTWQTLRSLALDTVLGLAVIAVAIMLVLVGGAFRFGLGSQMFLVGTLGGPPIAFFLVGLSVHRSRRMCRAGTAGIVCSPFVLTALIARTTTSPIGPSARTFAIFYVAICLLASPLFLLGWYVGSRKPE